MSLWKFGDFETEVRFSDADFLERLEKANDELNENCNAVPKTGKLSDIVRAECSCFYDFFDTLFGKGTADKMYGGKNDVELCVESASSLFELRKKEDERWNSDFARYQVQNHGNRQQRRNYQKKNGYYRNRNKG